jgi:hypothetical protein
MAILALQRQKKLAAYGEQVGREGMSRLVADAVANWQKSGAGPKGAMILAGRLKAITQMATNDDYWREQVDKGFMLEFRALPMDCSKEFV